MSQTPLWVPLVVAGLGVIATVCGTLAGVLVTQRRSDRREAVGWERERDRERERWAREDALRTFDHRRSAYESFYESLRGMALMAYNHGLGLSPEPRDQTLPEGWQTGASNALQHLTLYATPRVYDAASVASNAAWRWGHATTHGQGDDAFYDRQLAYDAAELELLDVMRLDLGIPEASLTTPNVELT